MKSLPRGRHERLQVSELQARVAELEEELAGARTTEVSDDPFVVGEPGLEDSRNAYAETLLRLPRSERLKEMRALAERVRIAVCCARATTGHAAVLPSPAMNVRRFIE